MPDMVMCHAQHTDFAILTCSWMLSLEVAWYSFVGHSMLSQEGLYALLR